MNTLLEGFNYFVYFLFRAKINLFFFVLSQLRGCNLQACTYVTNPIAFSNLGGNYENINNMFDRFGRSQQLSSGQTKGYLNTSSSSTNVNSNLSTTGSLNFSNNQSATSNSSQHQMMGLPSATNAIQSRTNCSSPASISSKSSPTGNEDLESQISKIDLKK